MLTEARCICLIIVRAEEASGTTSTVDGKLTPVDVSQMRDGQDGAPQRSPSLLLNIACRSRERDWIPYIISLIGEEFW